MKPTRAEFKAKILRVYPGAQVIEADRGLIVIVGTEPIARQIAVWAIIDRLTPQSPETDGPDSWTFRIFGVQRQKRVA